MCDAILRSSDGDRGVANAIRAGPLCAERATLSQVLQAIVEIRRDFMEEIADGRGQGWFVEVNDNDGQNGHPD